MRGDADEAAMMTALLSGFVFSGLQNLDGILKPPLTWERCDPDGTIVFRLASGMSVTITIKIEPSA